MKNLLSLLVVASVFLCAAQNDRSPVYDYNESDLTSTATIPDYDSKSDKLKITGTIYQSDGVTPAENVILHFIQTNEDGNYELESKDDKKRVKHRAWVKTDAKGQYTFYTFVPNTDLRNRSIRHISAVVKEPSKDKAYDINRYLFDDDPYLSKHCRKKLKKRGINNILKLEKQDNISVATRDIVLNSNLVSSL